MSRPYSSVNRFAALDSLPVEPVQRKPKPANGHAQTTKEKVQPKPKAVVNGHANSNAGKVAKDRTSTSSNDTVPSMESTITKRPAKKQKATAQRSVDKSSPLPKPLKKIDWEIPRKSLHASIGFLVLYLYQTRPPSVWPLIRGLAATGAFIYLVDLVRLRSPGFARTYNRALGLLMRESEKTSVNGVVWYLIGVTFTLAVYPRDIAVIAVMT
jgi:diacylglycerol kinase (CTP)